jgi:hypothetical protein
MKRSLFALAAVAVLSIATLTTLAATWPGFAHGFAWGFVCGARSSSGLGWLDAYQDASTAVDRLKWLDSLDS